MSIKNIKDGELSIVEEAEAEIEAEFRNDAKTKIKRIARELRLARQTVKNLENELDEAKLMVEEGIIPE
jgi:hypothetical protein